jgi:branched-chain amino acid transport system ATP-binding protein
MASIQSPRRGLRSLSSPRFVAAIVLGVAAVVALVVLQPSLTRYNTLVLFQVFELIALAQAWNLLAGYGGLVSLAPAASVGLGGYAAAVVSIHLGLPLPFLPLAGCVAAAIFAALVSVPMFRFRGLYFTIATLVLAQALGVFMVNWNGLGGATGLFLTKVSPTIPQDYLYALGLAVIATVVVAFVLRTRLGLSLRALRDDEDTAQEMGVSTFRTKLWVFVVSSFLIGLVGGLQAARLGTIEPYGGFSLVWTINVVTTAIVGGIGTIIGPLFGAGFTIWMQEALSRYPELHVAITGAIVVVIIRFAPMGIWGIVKSLWQLALDQVWSRVRRKPAAADETEVVAPASPAGRAPVAIGQSGAALARSAVAGNDPADGGGAAALGRVLLRTKGVTKRYGDVIAVSEVDMELRQGQVLGIIGPNGAGKSTLVGMLSGALHADGGAVELDDADVTHVPAFKRARMGIGRTHQIPRPFRGMTVLENLLVARSYGGRDHSEGDVRSDCEAILQVTGLTDAGGIKADNLTLLQLKRLELARALALEPRILLLDEIGAGLVESELVELIALIQQLRHRVQAIVIVEHIMDVIQQCCDEVMVLDWGRLIAYGSVREVMTTPEVVACYLGTGCGEPATMARRKELSHEGSPLLVLEGVSAGYGHFRALTDVTFDVAKGEVIALLGANGAGKTTVARVISGMIPVTAGRVEFDGRSIANKPAHEVARRGLSHCMEGRHIFAELTVHENLVLAGFGAKGKAELQERIDRVYTLFDVLAERRNKSGKQLSGGQQQMLAIGRALMADPKLIVADEISLGLAPATVDRLYETLVHIRDEGTTMVIIEQNVERGLALADRVFVMEKGTIALGGTPAELRDDSRLAALYMGEAEELAPV